MSFAEKVKLVRSVSQTFSDTKKGHRFGVLFIMAERV